MRNAPYFIMSNDDKQEFIDTAIEMTDKFKIYFNLKEVSEIVAEVVYAYRSYRKIFIGTKFEVIYKIIGY